MLVSHISVSINSLTKGQLDLELLYGEFQYFPLKFPCEKKTQLSHHQFVYVQYTLLYSCYKTVIYICAFNVKKIPRYSEGNYIKILMTYLRMSIKFNSLSFFVLCILVQFLKVSE